MSLCLQHFRAGHMAVNYQIAGLGCEGPLGNSSDETVPQARLYVCRHILLSVKPTNNSKASSSQPGGWKGPCSDTVSGSGGCELSRAIPSSI